MRNIGFCIKFIVLCALLSIPCASCWGGELNAEQILTQADEARGNLKGVEWEVLVSAVEKERSSEMLFNVQARGFDVLATALSPPKDKGNKILLVDGNMWFHKPGLSKPVPIAQRQKLLGLAAYGDIASTNYAHDYNATPLQDEPFNGEICYVFDLKAKTGKATYEQIRYMVSKERLVGVKAEYFTVSGKKLKEAAMEYKNTVTVNGRTQPFISKVSIQEVLMSNDQTILTFNKTSLRDIPDHVFNLNLLVR